MWTRDNLDVLRGQKSESVDLVYADPPFNSNVHVSLNEASAGLEPIGASYVLSPGTAKNRRSLLRHGHRGMIGQADQLRRALGIHNDNRSGGTSHGQEADGSEEGQLTAKWPGTGNG